jgi:hypothetical protein
MNIFLTALLTAIMATSALAADTIIGDPRSGNFQVVDNAGRRWNAGMGYTTNGSGDIFTLGGVLASSDEIIGENSSGNRTLVDNAGRRWPATVLYTTDGAGNVIPISGDSGGVEWGDITGTLSDQTDLQSALDLKDNASNKDNGALSTSSTSYPTSGAAKAYVDSLFSTKSTTNLAEGANLYFTNGRVDTEFDTRLATKSTSNLAEGSNLYYTDARVQAAAKAGTGAQHFYVTKDNGNDANDCSILKPCQTIQTGINAAEAISAYYKQTIVHVAPASGGSGSAYNENITFSQQGVNLACDAPQANTRACLISGTVTVNLSGTSGGANYAAGSNEVYMSGFVTTVTGSNNNVTFSGTAFQRFVANNCYFDNGGTGSAAVVSNSGSSGGTKSTFSSYDSVFTNNNASNPTVSITNGRFWMFGTQPIIQQTSATNKAVIQSGAASSFVCNLCAITGQVQVTDNTASATLNLSTIASGSMACVDTPASPNVGIITLAYFGCTSTNTNSVTGSGVVFTTPGNIRLSTSGDIVSTVTQAVVPGLPQGELMLGAGATTGTNVLLSIKNGHTKTAQTTAPTATVNSNAGTGATCTVTAASSDERGKLNLTTTATAPASGIQCTMTFNKAFSSTPHCMYSPANNNSILFAVANGTVIVGASTTTMTVTYSNADTLGHANSWTYDCKEN